MLGFLLGCGLRRSEVANLEIGRIQCRDGHWAIVDLVGKAGHVRTVPVPLRVKTAIDSWSSAAGIGEGTLFRAIRKNGVTYRPRFRFSSLRCCAGRSLQMSKKPLTPVERLSKGPGRYPTGATSAG